ncbi:MAG: MauE/DoxX family redox-associated membrane protein [Phycisphaerales bacterium]|jgi:uncharacterized membrane protein YphA (DoxX/SURF4 family)
MPSKIRPLGWLVLPCRIILGGLFVFAGVIKLMNPQLFQQAIAAFKVPGMPSHLEILLTFVVPWCEIAAGAALLLGLWTRSAALLLSSMLVVFIALISSVLWRGMDVKCGCFGKFEVPCTGPVGPCHLVRNGVLLALGLMVVFFGPGPLAIDRESTK